MKQGARLIVKTGGIKDQVDGRVFLKLVTPVILIVYMLERAGCMGLFSEMGQVLPVMERYGVWGLVVMTFLDSFISPVPPEVLFIPLCLVNPEGALGLALITTGVSVVGAVIGYWLGQKGGRPLLLRFFSREKIRRAEDIIKAYGAMAVLTAAFTPIPFKLITITSGVLNLPLKKMLFWSVLGRAARFFLEAGLIMIFGRAAVDFLESSNFALLTVAITAAALAIYAIWLVCRKRAGKRV